jgi:hypothetical protein
VTAIYVQFGEVAGVADVYLDALMVSMSPTAAPVTKYSHATKLWQAGNRELVIRSALTPAREVRLLDLRRLDGGRFAATAWQVLLGGSLILVNARTGVAPQTVRVLGMTVTYQEPTLDTLQLSVADHRISDAITSGIERTTGGVTTGGSGTGKDGADGAPGGAGTPGTSYTPENLPEQQFWMSVPFSVPKQGDPWTATNLPSAPTERWTGSRTRAPLERAIACYASTAVTTVGAAGSQQLVAYSLDNGTTWRAMNGKLLTNVDAGPAVAVDANTGIAVVSPRVPIATAARVTPCLLGLFERGGDGTTDPVSGNTTLYVLQSTKPGAFVPEDVVGCPVPQGGVDWFDWSDFTDWADFLTWYNSTNGTTPPTVVASAWTDTPDPAAADLDNGDDFGLDDTVPFNGQATHFGKWVNGNYGSAPYVKMGMATGYKIPLNRNTPTTFAESHTDGPADFMTFLIFYLPDGFDLVDANGPRDGYGLYLTFHRIHHGTGYGTVYILDGKIKYFWLGTGNVSVSADLGDVADYTGRWIKLVLRHYRVDSSHYGTKVWIGEPCTLLSPPIYTATNLVAPNATETFQNFTVFETHLDGGNVTCGWGSDARFVRWAQWATANDATTGYAEFEVAD